MNFENDNNDLKKKTPDIPRLTEWRKGLLDVLGMSSTLSRTAYSKDQIIGLIRKYEHGNDPFEEQRRSNAEETIKGLEVIRSVGNRMYPFRDNLDEKIWETYQLGYSFTPPEMRPLKPKIFRTTSSILGDLKTNQNNDDK